MSIYTERIIRASEYKQLRWVMNSVLLHSKSIQVSFVEAAFPATVQRTLQFNVMRASTLYLVTLNTIIYVK